MAQIYVSSTYEDLQRHRRAVCDVIRKLGHIDVAMEYYVAEHQRPIVRCLLDVRHCDVYVGIFAWRYGYVPPGESLSITELEYREAIKGERLILPFVLDASHVWPSRLVDRGDSGARIEALRSEITSRFVCGMFGTPQSLALEVSAALAKVGHWEPTPLDYEREQRLINTWRDARDPIERSRARSALVHMGSPRFAAILKDLVVDDARSLSTSMDIEDLITLCGNRAELLAIFQEVLRSGDAVKRAIVVFSVGELVLRGLRPADSVVKMVAQQANDSAGRVRKEVAHALGKVKDAGFGSPAVVDALRTLAEDTDADVAQTARRVSGGTREVGDDYR